MLAYLYVCLKWILSMIKIKTLLKENPDKLNLQHKILNYDDDDAVTFGYYKSKMMVGFAHEDNPVTDVYHSQLPLIYNMDEYVYRTDIKYAGRLWYDEKIISLWGKLPNRFKLSSIILDIKRELMDIINGKPVKLSVRSCKQVLDKISDLHVTSPNWKIEIPINRLEIDDAHDVYDDTAVLKPLSIYRNSNVGKILKPFEPVDHVKSPMIKRANVAPGFGSRTTKYGDSTATQEFQKKYTSETKK